MKKQVRKSASQWKPASERALLEIWADKMCKLRNCRKNSHILLEMVEELHEQGYTYTLIELKTKMHNLTARYRKEKEKVEQSGGSASEWDLYKDIHALLASYNNALVMDSINNINKPQDLLSPEMETSSSLLEASTSMTAASPTNPVTSPTTPDPPSPPIPRCSSSRITESNIENIFLKMENKIEELSEDLRKNTERLVSIEEEKISLLRAYVEREAEVQKALLEFLKKT